MAKVSVKHLQLYKISIKPECFRTMFFQSYSKAAIKSVNNSKKVYFICFHTEFILCKQLKFLTMFHWSLKFSPLLSSPCPLKNTCTFKNQMVNVGTAGRAFSHFAAVPLSAPTEAGSPPSYFSKVIFSHICSIPGNRCLHIFSIIFFSV